MLIRSVVALVSAALVTSAVAAQELRTVRVAVVNLTTDLAFYIAQKRGYLREEGLTAEFVYFDSGAKMIAPLGAGQIDAGGGATSAGLYNAVERGIDLRVVADKGTNREPYSYKALMVRKALVEGGAFASLADLKGRKAAVVAKGAADESVLHQAILKGGLADAEVERVFLPFAQHLVAFQNGGIDAAISGEPEITQQIRAGVAVRFAGISAFYPVHQTAVLLYGGKFAQDGAAATRFLKAYLRAVRDYDRALKDGRIAGPGADDIVQLLSEMTGIKDQSLLREAVPPFIDPNGALTTQSMQTDLDYFKSIGLVKGDTTVARVVDRSFLETVVPQLGRYERQK